MKDLTETAQALQAYIIKGQEDQLSGNKRKKMEYLMSKPLRPPLFKKGNSGHYDQFQKKGGEASQSKSIAKSHQFVDEGLVEGQSNVNGSFTRGALE
jgi:hypothetical protein